MKISLTEEERAELKRLHRQQKDLKAGDRIKAILLLTSGYTREEVARILLRDEGTITAWQNSFATRENLTSWLKDKNEGYWGRLTPEQMKEVDAFVVDNLIQDARQIQASNTRSMAFMACCTGSTTNTKTPLDIPPKWIL